MKQLRIEGTARPALIEEAIGVIQKSPTDALMTRYFGIKNYAGFGDQREDHEYGYGPKHGAIVFRIERHDNVRQRQALDADAIYLLEAYRDFGTVRFEDRGAQHPHDRVKSLSLCGAIRMLDVVTKERNVLLDAFEKVGIEAHVSA